MCVSPSMTIGIAHHASSTIIATASERVTPTDKARERRRQVY